jgi:dCTP deaminase
MTTEIVQRGPDGMAERPTTGGDGVFPSQTLEQFVERGHILADVPIQAAQVQPASLDLRLGAVAYRIRASFFPGPSAPVMAKVAGLQIHEIDLERSAVLEPGCIYLVPLLESLHLPPQVSGKANPKSTTGRLDVFTRLLADAGGGFDSVPAGYQGPLYIEIIPRTFSIVVRQGTRMNQLRLVQGTPGPSDAELSALHADEPLVYIDGAASHAPAIDNGLWISVDLQGREDTGPIGYKARRHAPGVDLDQVDYYDPAEFWEPLPRPKNGQLILDPEDFYLLTSRERIRIPPSVAAELVSYDPSVGEFRVHYAGFFDPGFGHGAGVEGTHAVLEIRAHGVPFVVEHEQRIGRLQFENLLARPRKLYGATIGSAYQQQGLALGKPFKRLRGSAPR